MIELFAEHLPPDAIVVEAGAHLGEDTAILAGYAAEVHAFEPVPALYDQLVQATAEYPNVRTYKLALGGKDETRDLWVSSASAGGAVGDGSSSLLSPTLHRGRFPSILFAEPIRVEAVTLGSWAKTAGVPRVDACWLDMQGVELEALRAAGTLLDQVGMMVLEFSVVPLYNRNPLWPELSEWLDKQGFEVTFEQLTSGDPQGNVLVTRR